MGAILLGAAVLVGLMLLARGFTGMSVAAIRQALVWGAAALGAALVVLLVVAGRGGQAIGALALFGPLAWRWWQARRTARGFGAPPAAGPASEVTTALLRLSLDHATGLMRGEVLAGRFAGRALDTLDPPELLALLAEAQRDDAESVPLLEAWLDRVAPDWRATAPERPTRDGVMDRAEALAILGLAEGADEAAIRAAHRRLLQAAHPDRGGSDWLAARINEARDLLLR